MTAFGLRVQGPPADRLCPLCELPSDARQMERIDSIWIECARCGRYSIDRFAEIAVRQDPAIAPKRYILSAATRQASDNDAPLRLVTDELPALIAIGRVPKTPQEAMDRLLLVLHQRTQSFRGHTEWNNAVDYPLLTTENAETAGWLMTQLTQFGLIKQAQGQPVELTLRGWERIEALRTTGTLSNQAFIAMAFDRSLDSARDQGFVRALEATGYTPVVLSLREHNGLIDDVILSEIKRSGLLIADFTLLRGGVYFEAGFAMGLGVPVIRTRKADDGGDLHFDVNHYNFIFWTDEADLREKLERRIRATIPGRARS